MRRNDALLNEPLRLFFRFSPYLTIGQGLCRSPRGLIINEIAEILKQAGHRIRSKRRGPRKAIGHSYLTSDFLCSLPTFCAEKLLCSFCARPLRPISSSESHSLWTAWHIASSLITGDHAIKFDLRKK